MTAAFVITLEISSSNPEELYMTAVDLQEVLTGEGFTVVSVDPWARPSQQPNLTTLASVFPDSIP